MDAPLFNQKTIDKQSEQIKLNEKQIDATSRWLKLIKEGALIDEKRAYIEFTTTVLRDILGYDTSIEFLKHEEKFMDFSFNDKSGKTRLCIEVKGTKTKDLFADQHRRKDTHRTPILQTWDYMSQYVIPYGIVTNYRDFILLDYSKGYRKLHFFDFISIEEDNKKLKEFILIFSKNSTIDDSFLTKLYNESVLEERDFTKEFYKLFHETRLMLIKEFQENGLAKDESIRYAQLFLNRMMFIFFCEDTGKIKKRLYEETILKILKNPIAIDEKSHYVFEITRTFFEKLDKGSDFPYEIFGFNGGLFSEYLPNTCFFRDIRRDTFFEEIYQHSKLSAIPILDEFSKNAIDQFKGRLSNLVRNLLLMGSYDFSNEINVNILGHIFEQSISDLEEIKSERKKRRKKEGIYYTPEFVTDYICRNTIVPYFSKFGVNSIPELIQEYSENISELENKFKSVKILDPACGSGAFLIKVVEILLEIQREVQAFKEDTGKYTKRRTGNQGVKWKEDELYKWAEEDEARKIIENNIYGVDLNEESVEITKLSLFLRIVQRNKKLMDSLKNIKCGNSLFDEIDYAGDKAFDWNKAFPEIMKNGGFDIIVGNPPYVDIKELDENTVKNIFEKYKCTYNRMNLYSTFVERSLSLLKNEGYFCFIIPNSILYNDSYEKLRKLLLNTSTIKDIVRLPDDVFEGVKVETIILALQKRISTSISSCNVLIYGAKDSINIISPTNSMKVRTIFQKHWFGTIKNQFTLTEENARSLLLKIEQNKRKLGDGNDALCEISLGITPYDKYQGHTPEQINNKVFHSTSQTDSSFKPLLKGEDITRYSINWSGENFIKYGDWLGAPREKKFFTKPRIVIRQIVSGIPPRIFAGYTEEEVYNTQIGFNIIIKDENLISYQYLLSILNSKLMNFYHKENFLDETKTLFQKILIANARKFPIEIGSPDQQQELSSIVDELIEIKKLLDECIQKFLNRLRTSYKIDDFTNKITNFYDLNFSEFYQEMIKIKTLKLNLNEQEDLEDYFNKYKTTISELFQKISQLDSEIDEKIYSIYKLEDQEIKLVEEFYKK